MELFDWPALCSEFKLVNGILLLPIDVLEIGLIELKIRNGAVWH